MAVAQTEASGVRKGLADRMKPKEAQSTQASGQTNYASRFQNPGAGSNRSRTLDRSKFQNPNVGRAPRRPQPTPYTGATQPRPSGQVPNQYQTPGRPQYPQRQVAQPTYAPKQGGQWSQTPQATAMASQVAQGGQWPQTPAVAAQAAQAAQGGQWSQTPEAAAMAVQAAQGGQGYSWQPGVPSTGAQWGAPPPGMNMGAPPQWGAPPPGMNMAGPPAPQWVNGQLQQGQPQAQQQYNPQAYTRRW